MAAAGQPFLPPPDIRQTGNTIMMTLSTPRFLAAAAAVTGLLLLAPVPQAEAGGHGAWAGFGTGVTTGTAKSSPPPVVRDHRKPPRWVPWVERACRTSGCPQGWPR